MLMGWDYVSELQPLMGLLFISRWYEYGEPQWNDIDRENRRTQRKTCPSATLPARSPRWSNLGANSVLCCERPATNPLNYVMGYNLT
jgi:hypothetical protein